MPRTYQAYYGTDQHAPGILPAIAVWGRLPDGANDFRESIARAAHYAETTDARRVHVMAGMADMEDARAQATYRDSIAFAADYFASRQIEAVVELINGRDIPGYFLQDFDFAFRLIEGCSDGGT
jgi:hydroxypyruvate isomerase